MRLHADSYFAIGAAHLTAGMPCQDYALSTSIKDGVCAVVSDGCSTGGRTDIGARIVALATASSLNVPANNFTQLIRNAQGSLGLNLSDMLATRLYAVAYLNLYAGLYVVGDGVAVIRDRRGTVTMTKLEWEENTPFYPAYLASSSFDEFVLRHGGDLSAPRLRAHRVTLNQGKKLAWSGDLSLGSGISGFADPVVSSSSDIDFLAVFSDGITQVDNVPWDEAVTECLAFKNTSGEFLKRRMMAAIRRWKTVGRGPIDDISGAVIHVEHDGE